MPSDMVKRTVTAALLLLSVVPGLVGTMLMATLFAAPGAVNSIPTWMMVASAVAYPFLAFAAGILLFLKRYDSRGWRPLWLVIAPICVWMTGYALVLVFCEGTTVCRRPWLTI